MQKTMKAVVLVSPGKLLVEEVPIFPLKFNEVQIKVSACGICGSDIRYLNGENPWALHTLGMPLKNPPNIILGHEFCGTVHDVASKENENLIGKRVVVSPFKPCGVCRDCRNGNYNLCKFTKHIGHAAGWGKMKYYPGGMAEYCPVWADCCYELPDSISDSEATFLDIAGVGIHALNRAGLKPGQTILLIGCGPLGYSIILLSKYWGANNVLAIEPNKRARKVISELGIKTFIGTENRLSEIILEKNNNKGIDSIFETVGTAKTQLLSRNVLSSQGVIVNLAIHHQKIELFMDELGREKTILSSCNYLFKEFKLAIDILTSGKISFKPYITHELPIEKAVEAFNLVGNRIKSGALKVILKP